MTSISKRDSYKWVVLSISFLVMLGFAISLQALPPIFSYITKDIPFTDSQAGMLMGAYAIPGIFLPFLVAFFASRIDLKKMIISALLIMIIGLSAFALAKSFTSLLVYRLVAGLGATVLIVLAPLLINMFFDERNIGIAMGIFNIAVPFGTVLAANLFGYLGKLVSWRSILFGIAIFVAIVLVVVFFGLLLPKKEPEKIANTSHGKPRQKFQMSLSLWILAAIWALANAQLLAFMTFGSRFFQSVGISVESAGFLTSLIMLMSIFLAPIVGILFDKTGRKKELLLTGTILMLIGFVFITKFLTILPLWTVALGIGFAPIPVFVFAVLPELVKPQQVGMGLGILTAAGNIGITLGPSAFGSILDMTAGNFSIGFMT
ncbi:MAG: CynX/NimT family MFS transporter, partial [Peptococcales bacterium]